MEPIEVIEYKGYNIKVFADGDCQNPREESEWFGHMICHHRRYNLGDKQEEYFQRDVDSFVEWIRENEQDLIYLPLYLYDHSGITMNTGGFSCPWDSGQVGFIYATKEEVRKEYGVKRISSKLRKEVYEILRSEVEVYDWYLTGQCYGYVVEKAGEEEAENEEIDSCWGFIGPYDDKDAYMIQQAKDAVDYDIEKENAA